MRITASFLRHGLLVLGLAGCSTRPPARPSPSPDPNAANCRLAIESARHLAESLPADAMSRRAAESDLVQANTEAGNGEFDDCLDYAHHAVIEVREHRHGP